MTPEVIPAGERQSPAKASRSKAIPTLEEVTAYCEERNNGINPQRFCDYYAAQGWKLSNGQKMRDWQAAVRNWESREREGPPQVAAPGPIVARSVSDLRYLDNAARGKALLEATLRRKQMTDDERAREMGLKSADELPPEWR